MPQLSAIVITRNEAANIGDCLDSVAFCDERIVVDCGSSDGTVDIAMTDLAQWHRYEIDNPRTFAQMYQFWVQGS